MLPSYSNVAIGSQSIWAEQFLELHYSDHCYASWDIKMIIIPTKQGQVPVSLEETFNFLWRCTCVLELEYVPCPFLWSLQNDNFSLRAYFHSEGHLSIQSWCPVASLSHKVFLWRFDQATKKEHNKEGLTIQLWLMPSFFFFPSFFSSFFVIGNFRWN